MEKIQSRSDVMRFFVHLYEDCSLAFHPDDSFEGYINLETGQRTFTEEECARFNKLMGACHDWCQKHGDDIYEIGMEATGFGAFLEDHIRLTNRDEITKFGREFIDPLYEAHDQLVALHSYGGCYWIEEISHQGKTMFQCVIENTNPYSNDLRDIEVELYNWKEKDMAGLSKKSQNPSKDIGQKKNVRLPGSYLKSNTENNIPQKEASKVKKKRSRRP